MNGSKQISVADSGRCGIVGAETHFGVPQEEVAMARRRYQSPKPQVRGALWTLLVWQDELNNGRRERKRKRITLGLATGPDAISAKEARRIASERLRAANQGLVTTGPAVAFNYFV